jgi:hypothetical protein
LSQKKAEAKKKNHFRHKARLMPTKPKTIRLVAEKGTESGLNG